MCLKKPVEQECELPAVFFLSDARILAVQQIVTKACTCLVLVDGKSGLKRPVIGRLLSLTTKDSVA
jgi:hypothetical protein